MRDGRWGNNILAASMPDAPQSQKSWLPHGFEFLSGLPERLRRVRIIVALQAWFDDSGAKGNGRYMSMAGLFGQAEALADLADQWDLYLRAAHPGAIRYFKMSEASGCRGEFQQWRSENRDAKVRQLADVIDRSDTRLLSATIDLEAFQGMRRDWLVSLPFPEQPGYHPFSQPYLLLSQHILASAVSEALERDAKAPIEVIYDVHDVFKPVILNSYEVLLAVVADRSPARRAVMPIQPWFRDDLEFVVLQCADLVAGDARLSAERQSDSGLCARLKSTRRHRFFDEQALRAMRLSAG